MTIDGPILRIIAEKIALEVSSAEFKTSIEYFDIFKEGNNLSFKVLSGVKKSADYKSAEEYKLLFIV